MTVRGPFNISMPVWIAALAMLYGCSGAPKPEISAGVDGCSHCQMVIEQTHQACGYVLSEAFLPFDSPGCLLRSYEALRKKGGELPQAIYFADYRNGGFRAADSTAFVLTDRVPTVMNAQVVCFGDDAAAVAFAERGNDTVLTWKEYQLSRGTPDRIVSIRVGPQGMSPESVEVRKGELVELELRGAGLPRDLALAVKGYGEIETIRLSPSGDAVSRRFWASRPGAGFPVVNLDAGRPVGMIKVSGAHTEDEAAQ